MSLIKIFVNNIQLDIVKETLSITKENNALIKDFKVAYSNFPFLIVENKKTIQALGSKNITSVRKQKVTAVTVEELGEKFYGEIQVISYINGFRKVTLKYSTELITLMDKNISDFMPIVSVIPSETNPVPYTETSPEAISGYGLWGDYPIPFLDQNFPEVKWQFPTMRWFQKFGKDLATDDIWYLYQNEINKYTPDVTQMVQNTFAEPSTNQFTIQNRNICAPQIYLLAPLFYALESIGWTAKGDFYTSEFFRRILFLSTKDNLCKSVINGTVHNVEFNSVDWIFDSNEQIWFKEFEFYTYGGGDMKLEYSFNITTPSTLGFTYTNNPYALDETIFENKSTPQSGTVNFFQNLSPGIVRFVFANNSQIMPADFILKVTQIKEGFNQMHPTIQTGRFLPDWSFGTYLNELKTFFNLDIAIDHLGKQLIMNFNEDVVVSGVKEKIRKSLSYTEFEQIAFDSFLIKYANDTDIALWIDTNGTAAFTNQKSEFTDTIESKFKFIPNNNYTAEISDELESKDGVGLMIYDTVAKPFVSGSYNSQTLKIEGAGGIYDVYFKKWLKFRLNASIIEVEGPFTEIELSRIIKTNKLFLDHQEYMVEYVSYSETDDANFLVQFRLHAVNF